MIDIWLELRKAADGKALEILRHLLGGHAARERAAVKNFLVAAEMLRPGLQPAWVPEATVFHLIHEAREEGEHYDAVMAVLLGLFGVQEGHGLADAAYARAAEIFPPPPTFMHQVAAMALVDRAGRIGMESMLSCAYKPYADCLRGIVHDEEGHGNHGDDLLRIALRHDPDLKPEIEAALQWAAPTAYRCFGRPDTELDRLGVFLRLKTHAATENVARFEAEIAPLLESLEFPKDLLIHHRRRR